MSVSHLFLRPVLRRFFSTGGVFKHSHMWYDLPVTSVKHYANKRKNGTSYAENDDNIAKMYTVDS